VRSRVLVGVLAGGCALLAAVAGIAWAAVGWSFHEAVDAFVVSNFVIGLSFGACGALVAWYRPGHPVGWLYLVGGLCQVLSAASACMAELTIIHGDPLWLTRLLVTVFALAWPLNIGICLPLSLYLLPDGRLPSPRWRPWFLLFAVTSPLFVLENGNGHSDGTFPDGFLLLPLDGAWSVLWSASELRWVLSMLVGLAALATRYIAGREVVRRQLLWVVLAAGFLLAAVTPWALVSDSPIIVLFAIPVLPAGIAVAVLRHGLLDIRLVIARSVAYLLLSSLVLAGYAVLVLVLSGVASALLVAMLALPLRARLQTAVERVLYGNRGDPARVAAEVGGALQDLSEGLVAVRASMRLPYAAIRDDENRVLGSSGSPGKEVVELPLGAGATLEVGLRAGERRLSAADADVLAMLSGPLAVAVSATCAAREVQLAREKLVNAREEERRRLRRDLHDGLGTLLTGVVLSADAAANTAASQPAESAALLATVRTDLRSAVHEVRRLVDDLRPVAVDDLGLVAALEVRAAQAVRRADGAPLEVSVETDLDGPLPVALEVAAYRIATEALTNIVRHSTASRARISVGVRDGALEVEVRDDGSMQDWGSGVGTTSMRERAEELGGTCERGPGPDGGLVRAVIPIGAP
jgi:two-component system NarL family sensor kinase